MTIDHLKLSNKNIHFVSDENDDMVDFAFKEFQKSKIVGFDLEEYWGKELCLIQLSTYQHTFLFDCLTL